MQEVKGRHTHTHTRWITAWFYLDWHVAGTYLGWRFL